ncbi:MAG TPA: twin-arginine translocase subunit TatC [Candidatus Acidoferrales bacterium]|nr:twin-arginine translocase subunit TatC [Candidatus Acidoferrales bacterium]
MTTADQPEAVAADAKGDGGKPMTFFEHLTELRKRIINSLMAIGAGAIVGVLIAEKIFGFIARPMLGALHDAHLAERLVYTSPTGAINLIIELGLYIGLVLASPVVLHQTWLFVAPALYKHERKAVVTFVASSVLLFLTGIAFGYYVMLPSVLRFLIHFKGPIEPLISMNEYFDLTLMVLLGLGIIFELPILIFFLSLFGVVTPSFLWKNFRYAILIISVVAAIVTPSPDAMTMLIFMAPMVLLYFVGIAVSAVVVKRKRERETARAAAP